ncbi:hypothetical protein OC25_03950 [Pedobacter kyungheensis]|uniref:Uncharacterized protein n=1 Tax=Pedobacter kyungheensis TaxID=1069985 RepID=A0A0C1FWK8_9SPHI|nr:hypothetical protein OC25_03950 [Pedobacter kyungheensis]
MAMFTISLNQFIEAGQATPRGKARIVEQQLNVNKLLTPWYQLAKNRMKVYFRDVAKTGVLKQALDDLKNKVPKDDKAKNNITVSIEAIHKVMEMGFEHILVNGYEVLFPDQKNIEIEGININVNPELVYRYVEDGVVKIGALKFHVSKSKPFGLQQSKSIANILRIYLQEKVVGPGEVVDSTLCWAYDVFGERLVHADDNVMVTAAEAKELCKELAKIYHEI